MLGLLKQAKGTVGFLPDEAVGQRILKGTLLVAVIDDEIVGYLLYDLPADTVTIRQLAIARDARKMGVARALVDELACRYGNLRRGIRLTCRRDFEANDVWQRLGFSPRSERPGRGKGGNVLTVWWRSFGQPDLFSLARENDDRPLAALDTNLLIRGADGAAEVVEHLLADWVSAEVVFGFVDHSLVEINGHEDEEARRRHTRYASGFDELQYLSDIAEALYSAVLEALGPTGARHVDDILLATRAAAAGARWFVTEDVPFRTACATALRDVADIDVVPISEMVLAADQLVRGELYHGRYLQGTDIEVREVTTGDLDDVARTFLNQRAGETFKVWRKHLHALATDVARTHLFLFCDNGNPVALGAVTSGDILEVPVCRVRRGAAEPTLARQLLGWLRDKCQEMGASAVQITDERPGQWIESRFVAEGFLPDRRPTGVPITGATTISGVGAILAAPPLATRLDSKHAEALSRLTPSPEAAHSVESVFHPVIITGAGLPTVRVPISLRYAIELFDHVLSEGRLWGRDRSVALRREHVYFRTPTAPSLLAAPARLLWQVTGDKRHGGGTLRAWSLLDETIVGDVDQLISRFSHLGVLNRTEILDMARAGKVMALRFSHTTVFPRPISLAEFRGIMGELEPGVGIVHVGPQPVVEQVFVHLATMAA
ncbi:MAG TPA: GNAT family N-acetyltransferase [Acidimicrobiales bacterium]|nr:GNAT family N-acetyltransferase [Acidimicrobiales bacterium]